MSRSGALASLVLVAMVAIAAEPLTPDVASVAQRGVVDLLRREGFAARAAGVTLGEHWVRPRGKVEVAWVFAAPPIEVRGRAKIEIAAPGGPTWLSGEIEELNPAASAFLAKRVRAQATTRDAAAAARQEHADAEKKQMFDALLSGSERRGVLKSAPPSSPSPPKADLRLPDALPPTPDAGQN